ncbi:MAG: hypothetical protein GWO02_01215, partial [Gammaproteobacteria bacterium]|nr:hypothetical protein [Gammaproteobacteria bacterium]
HFDLASAPLFRVRLFQFADADYLFVLTFHHLVLDGYAAGVLLRELQEFYSAEVEGRSLELPPAMQLSAYAAEQAARGDAAA